MAEIVLSGLLYPGGGSRAVEARLLLPGPDADEAAVEADGTRRRARIVEVSDRVGRVDRRIELDGGDAFVTPDNDAVDRLARARGRGPFGAFSRVAGLERPGLRLLALVAATIVAVVFLVRDGVPLAARGAAAVTPTVVTRTLDASARATLERIALGEATGLPEERRERLRDAFDELVGASARTRGVDYRLVFRDGGRIGPNALALPNGTVIVTDQLARLGSDEEIVAVIAHEIGHVEGRHSLQRIYRAAGLAAVATLVLGDPGPVLDGVVGGAGLLAALQASREMERDADARAVRLLAATGRDPTALASLLGKLEASLCSGGTSGAGGCGETDWLDSHPVGEDRAGTIRAEIERLDGIGRFD